MTHTLQSNKIDILFFGLKRENHAYNLMIMSSTIVPIHAFPQQNALVPSDKPMEITLDFSETDEVALDLSTRSDLLVTAFCAKGVSFLNTGRNVTLHEDQVVDLGKHQLKKVIFHKNGRALMIREGNQKDAALDYRAAPVISWDKVSDLRLE